jgi:hypothetical protein
MFVLGLILILLSAGALVAVLASGTDDQAAMYGGSLNLPTLVVFLAGAAALLLFIMGLELVRSGLKRATQNRKNTRRLRKLEKREAQRRAQEPGTAAPADATTGTTTGTTTGGTTAAPDGPAAAEPAPSAAPHDTARTGDQPHENPPPTR